MSLISNVFSFFYKRKSLSLCCGLTLWANFGFASDSQSLFSGGELSGFSKLHYTFTSDTPNDTSYSELSHINRLTILQQMPHNWSWEASYEFTPTFKYSSNSAVKINTMEIKRPYRISDFASTIRFNNDRYSINHHIDRLMVTHTTDRQTVSIGRQQVSFGSGRFSNPTDVFVPNSYQVVDTEVRNGVDAIRYRYQFGEMSQFDTGVVLGKNAHSKTSAVFALSKFELTTVEVQPLVIYFSHALLLGLDITTDLLGALVWLESAWVKPPQVTQNNEKPYVRSVLGTERKVSDDIVVSAEYQFNGAGSTLAKEYLQKLATFSHQQAGVYLLGRHYVDVGLGWQVQLLHTLSSGVKVNIYDSSCLGSVGWEYNPLEDIYFNASMMKSYGKKKSPERNIRSEFGDLPIVAMLRIRLYY